MNTRYFTRVNEGDIAVDKGAIETIFAKIHMDFEEWDELRIMVETVHPEFPMPLMPTVHGDDFEDMVSQDSSLLLPNMGLKSVYFDSGNNFSGFDFLDKTTGEIH